MIKDKNQSISENPKNDLLINEQEMILKKDLLYFKNDILKDIKQIEIKLNTKYNDNSNNFDLKFQEYDNKINTILNKISEITNLIPIDNNIKEKVEKINKKTEKIEEIITINEIKLNSIDKDLNSAIYKYDKMFSDTVIYPGIIGNLCKFKTFHDYIDYVLIEIKKLIEYKEKNVMDLKSYKKKLDTIIENFKLQTNNIIEYNKEYTNRKVNENEMKIYENLKIYDGIIKNIRIENAKFIIDSKKEYNNILKEWEKIIGIKNEIFIELNNQTEKIEESNNLIYRKLEGYKKEFNIIKNRFTQLSEFIKDVRFRINIGEDIKKRDVLRISKKIDFSKKQTIKKGDIKDNNSLLDYNKSYYEHLKKNSLKKNNESILISRRFSLNNLSKKFSFNKLNFINNDSNSSISSIQNLSDEENNNKNSNKINRSKTIQFYQKKNYSPSRNIKEKNNKSNKSENISSIELLNSIELNNNDLLRNAIHEKNIIDKKTNINEENKNNKNHSKSGKTQLKYINLLNLKKKQKPISSTKRNHKFPEEELLTQNKSYTNFPKIASIKNNINEQIKEKKEEEKNKSQKLSYTTRNNNENLNQIDNIEYKFNTINANNIDNNFIGNSIQVLNIKTKYAKNIISQPNKINIKKYNDKKSNLNKKTKIEDLKKDFKVHIPNFEVFYSKYGGESIENNNNNNFKGSKLSNHSINDIISSFQINKNKSKNSKYGKYCSYSQEKDIHNNYYYNLMINDDNMNEKKNDKKIKK